MKTTIIITAVVATLLLTSGVAWARQYGGPGGEHRGARMMEKIGERLELDEQQKAKLSQFSEKLQAMRKEKREAHKGGRQELISLLDTVTLDREKALSLLDERHQTFKNHMTGMVDAFAEFSDSLNTSQREELKEIFAQRMEQRRGGSRWGH